MREHIKEREKRPDIRPEWSAAEKVMQIVCPLVILATGIYLIASWTGLPAKVPVHFGFFGDPDRYGSKREMLTMPIIALCLYLMVTVFERFPRLYNFPFEITERNAAPAYQIARELLVGIKTEMCLIFAYILVCQIQMAKGLLDGTGVFFLPVVVVVLGLTAVVYFLRMRKIKE